MAKYGRGLNCEIVAAVNKGIIIEPFGVSDVRRYANLKGWDVPETYVTVTLANASSEQHSPTYKKYFNALGDGDYKVRFEFRSPK